MAESISDCCLDIIRSYLVHVYSRHNVWLLVVFSLKGSESVCVCDCTNRQRFTGSSNSLPAAAGSKSNQHVPKVRSCCFSCLLIQCRNENGFTKSSSHQEGCCGCRRFAFHTFDPSTHISGQPCALAGEHVRTHS